MSYGEWQSRAVRMEALYIKTFQEKELLLKRIKELEKELEKRRTNVKER